MAIAGSWRAVSFTRTSGNPMPGECQRVETIHDAGVALLKKPAQQSSNSNTTAEMGENAAERRHTHAGAEKKKSDTTATTTKLSGSPVSCAPQCCDQVPPEGPTQRQLNKVEAEASPDSAGRR